MNRKRLNYKKAVEYINNTEDPITKALLLNAHFHVMDLFSEPKQSRGEGLSTSSPFDMLSFYQVLGEIFKEHNVLKKILQGEEVGKWFKDNFNELS